MKCRSVLGAVALTTALSSALAPSADAAVVVSGPVNITIGGVPPGVFLNVVTGQVGTSFSGVPGADLNLFGFGASLTVSGPIVNGAQSPTGGFARLNNSNNVWCVRRRSAEHVLPDDQCEHLHDGTDGLPVLAEQHQQLRRLPFLQ